METVSFSESALQEKLLAALESGKWGTISPVSVAAAQRLAALAGTECALLCASPVAALETVLRALELSHGSRVVLPALCSPYLRTATEAVGASPVYADIGDDLHIRPQSVAYLANADTSAVLVEELGGYPCEIDKIAAICAERDIPLIDCTPAPIAAQLHQKPTVTFADFGIAALPAQGAGAILCEKAYLEKVFAAHHCGNPLGTGAALNAGICLGGDMRIDEWRSVLLLELLERAAEQMRLCNAVKIRLREALCQKGMTPVDPVQDGDSAGHFLCFERMEGAPAGADMPFEAHSDAARTASARILWYEVR